MCNIEIVYKDNFHVTFEDIIYAEYTPFKTIRVSEKDLLTYSFPTGHDISFHSQNNAYIINGTKVKSII